jgi:hypothetical protein
LSKLTMKPTLWLLTAITMATSLASGNQPPAAQVTVDYPLNGSVFPPEFPAPQFLWRDTSTAKVWRIEVAFHDGSAPIRALSKGEPMRIGEIDKRAIAPTNKPPALTPQQAAAHTWRPAAEIWAQIKRHSVEQPAEVTILGCENELSKTHVSSTKVTILTSKDPVGAPVFYRDVPLMSVETEPGVIKPIPPAAVPLIAWRLRNIGETSSRLLVDNLPTCANCHSFSRDGKTLGMDLDGPQNDKGLYALTTIQPQTEIRNEDVVSWSSFKGKLGGKLRVGFMSQVSPDGRYVVTTIWPTSRTTASSRSSIPRAASSPGTAAKPASSSHCPAPTTKTSCKATSPGAPTAAMSSSPAPKRKTPIPKAPNPPNSPTIPTKPRSATTSTASPSTTAKAAKPSRSPEPPPTA